MHVILHRMRSYHGHSRQDILEDLNECIRLLSSSLFIGRTLEEQHLNKKWEELIGNIFDELRQVTEIEFFKKTTAFQSELVSVAQDDLKFKRNRNRKGRPTP